MIKDNLKGLNEEQRQGVTHNHGPLLILAGAGSGKTRVITTRISFLIRKLSVSPSNILALTFTNKSGKEMKERVIKMLSGRSTKGLWVGTFHGFCVKILKENIHLLGYRKSFSIFNSSDKIHLIGTILKEMKISEDNLSVDQASWKISDAKNQLLHPDESHKIFDDKVLIDVYKKYQETLKGFNIVDFDDLLMLAVDIFSENPEISKKYSSQYKYIMVDEYQDTNFSQYSLLRYLTKTHNNICVVGDDDQSIYGWRGADISNILNFEKDFDGAKVIRLEQNYRSTATILAAANNVIKKNTSRKGKKLWTSGDTGQKISVISAIDEQDEAGCVVSEIISLRRERKMSFNNFAIIFRTNFQSRSFEEELSNRGIPYEVVGGYKFYDRKEVKDIIAYLRLLANKNDEIAFLRIINMPKRGVGPVTIKKMLDYSKMHSLTLYETMSVIDKVKGIEPAIAYKIDTFYEIIEEFTKKIFTSKSMSMTLRELIKVIGYEDELLRDCGNNMDKYQKSQRYVEEVVNILALYETDDDVDNPDLFGFLNRIALMNDDTEKDEDEKKRDAVMLLTVHSCKGLEFPYVFICCVEEGSMPHIKSIENNNDVEEERRLFYVGITRAMNGLTLSFAETRRKYGEYEEKIPSRFLEEIDDVHLDWQTSSELNEMSDDDFDNVLSAFEKTH